MRRIRFSGFPPRLRDEASLRKVFGTFGSIVGLTVASGENDSAVSGICKFASAEDAALTLEALHGLRIGTFEVNVENDENGESDEVEEKKRPKDNQIESGPKATKGSKPTEPKPEKKPKTEAKEKVKSKSAENEKQQKSDAEVKKKTEDGVVVKKIKLSAETEASAAPEKKKKMVAEESEKPIKSSKTSSVAEKKTSKTEDKETTKPKKASKMDGSKEEVKPSLKQEVKTTSSLPQAVRKSSAPSSEEIARLERELAKQKEMAASKHALEKAEAKKEVPKEKLSRSTSSRSEPLPVTSLLKPTDAKKDQKAKESSLAKELLSVSTKEPAKTVEKPALVATAEVQESSPRAPVDQPSQPVPLEVKGPLWEEYIDETYNCPYFFNPDTNETTWDPPPAGSRIIKMQNEYPAKEEEPAGSTSNVNTSEQMQHKVLSPKPSPKANRASPRESPPESSMPFASSRRTGSIDSISASSLARTSTGASAISPSRPTVAPGGGKEEARFEQPRQSRTNSISSTSQHAASIKSSSFDAQESKRPDSDTKQQQRQVQRPEEVEVSVSREPRRGDVSDVSTSKLSQQKPTGTSPPVAGSSSAESKSTDWGSGDRTYNDGARADVGSQRPTHEPMARSSSGRSWEGEGRRGENPPRVERQASSSGHPPTGRPVITGDIVTVRQGFGFIHCDPPEYAAHHMYFPIDKESQALNLRPGDRVEFVVGWNRERGQTFAYALKRIPRGSRPSPEASTRSTQAPPVLSREVSLQSTGSIQESSRKELANAPAAATVLVRRESGNPIRREPSVPSSSSAAAGGARPAGSFRRRSASRGRSPSRGKTGGSSRSKDRPRGERKSSPYRSRRARSRSAGPPELRRMHSAPDTLQTSKSWTSKRDLVWEKYTDPKSGRPYWHCVSTNETTWDDPYRR